MKSGAVDGARTRQIAVYIAFYTVFAPSCTTLHTGVHRRVALAWHSQCHDLAPDSKFKFDSFWSLP